MTRCVAFLRAINVGGHRVSMEELRRLFVSMSFEEVETFIASGNVLFTAPRPPGPALVKRMEAGLKAGLGYEVCSFLRTGAEVAAICRDTPFSPVEVRQAAALNVGLLADPLPAPARKRLQSLATDIDAFQVHGREIYWLCRRKQSESTFSNAVFERTLGVRATFRTIKTFVRLVERYDLG